MDVPCRVSAERIELQLIRAAPGNPNPCPNGESRPRAAPPAAAAARRAGSLESFFLDRVRGGLIQCINKIVRHLAAL